jgi:hypothetical protein
MTFMVMEYLPGGDLGKLVKKGEVPEPDKRSYVI